jgi:iron(III) transport system ATP-binding protein
MTDLLVRGVHKTLGRVHVLKGASFTAERGQITALLGASGSGKTTLLRAIAGLETPEEGLIEIGRTPVLDTAKGLALPPERRNIGLVFQSYALWPHRTVFDNVGFGLKLRGRSAEETRRRVGDTLARLGLADLADRYPDQLSGGQQQRVAICRALVYEPKVLLLDEPLSNLDAKLREEARYWIRKLILDLEICAVIVTHDQGEALAMSDRVLLLKDGAIVQEDSPQAIYGNPKSLYAAEFLGANNVIPGRLVTSVSGAPAIAGEDWTIEGVIQGTDPASGRPGSDEGTAVIRVEGLSIAGQPGSNRLPMRLDASIFLGDRWEYRLSRGNLKVVAHGAAPLDAAEVWCAFPREHVWIFAPASPSEARPFASVASEAAEAVA